MASFEDVVDPYDAARPGYPSEVFDALEPLDGRLVLDAGAGTGIATRPLLARNANVVALDPGRQLLTRARQHSPGLPAVVGDAGRMPFADATFDLVCFAQSWHWVDTATRCREVRRVLRPGGRWAGWWSHARADGEDWFDEYWTLIESTCRGTHRRQRDIDWGATVAESALMTVAERITIPWRRTVSVDAWMTDLMSHIYIAALTDNDRSVLLERVRLLITRRFPNGQMDVAYETWLWTATS